MWGKFNSMLLAVLAGAVMSWGSAHAQSLSFAYDLKVVGAESASLTFGRIANATDAADALDFPAPPAGVPTRVEVEDQTIPVSGVINYMYLQGGQGSADPQTSKIVGDAYYRLSEDYKSPDGNASTWVLVIADTVGSTVALSWTPAAAGAAPANGTFTLTDANGTVKVADLRLTASANLAMGTYFITYQMPAAPAAPPTPAPLRDAIAKAAGLSKDITLDFDPALFKAGNFVIYYYDGTAPVIPGGGTRAVGATINGNVLTFTMPDDISGFDSVVINYTLTRIGAPVGAPSATGAVELSSEDIIAVDLTEVAVGGAAADITGDPIKVKVDYTDAAKTAYKPITVAYELAGVADALTEEPNRYVFTGPAWKGAAAEYPWAITFDVTNPAPPRADVVFAVAFAENGGVVTPTYTADIASQTGQILTVTLQPALAAKGGTVDFDIIALEAGQETADVFTTPSVTFQLKGDGNLDVDNSDDGKKVEYPDIVYIFRYRFLNGKATPLNLLLGTADAGNVQKATEIRDRILDMEGLLDVDLSDNGTKIEYPDIIYIFRYRFLNGSTNALNLLLGTASAGNQALATAIQQRIAELLD